MKNGEVAAYPLAAEDPVRPGEASLGSPAGQTANVAPTVTITGGADAAPVGDEFRINTIIDGEQRRGELTALADGGFIATWRTGHEPENSPPNDGIYIPPLGYAQRYDANGIPVGEAMPIGNAIGLLGLAGGGFVGINDLSESAPETGDRDIIGRLYDEALNPLGEAFRVNSVASDDQAWPTGVGLEGGGFVVTWEAYDGSSLGIFAQVFDAGGQPSGDQFRVNTATYSGQLLAKTIALPGGGFLVSWVGRSTGSGEVYAQRFDASGAKVGGEFRVNNYLPNTQWDQSIAVLEDGGLIFVWEGPGFDGARGIFGRRFDAAGNALGGDFRISELDGSSNQVPFVAAMPGGGFVVAWDAYYSGASPTGFIAAQCFDAAGNAIGPAFQVSSTGDVNAVRVQALADGRLAFMWTADAPDAADVYGRIFEPVFRVAEQAALDLKGAIAIGDVDAASAAMTVTLSVDHGRLDVAAGTSGAVVAGSGGAAVTITGTLAEIQALLADDPSSAVAYVADSDEPPASATLTVLADDGDSGGALTAVATEIIHINSVNDAPVNAVGSNAAGVIGNPIAITGVSVSDPDGTGEITVHLEVAHGTLTILTDVPDGIGAADITGGGNGTRGITLTATPDRINATLAAGGGLAYRGDPGFHGLDALSVSSHEGVSTDAPDMMWKTAKTVGASPSDIAAGDVNGDRVLDLVVANKGAGTISVMLGSGDGNFGTPISYTVGSGPFGVALANLNDNQDNFLDIVVTNSLGGTIGVLRGSGNGTFQAQSTTPTLTPMRLPEALVTGDFNGDGHADIACTTRNQGVEVRFGTGNGGFSGGAQYALGSAAVGPFSPVAIDKGDFNGDGFLDLIVANSSGGTPNGSVSLLLGSATGAFANAIVLPAPTRPRDIEAADFNGDGRLDFALADGLASSVSVFLGNGDGSFQSGVAYAVTRPGVSLSVADLNGDGRPDIVAGVEGASPSAALIEMLIGNGDGTFRPGDWEIAGDNPAATVAGDFDGDGRIDIATANNADNNVTIYANRGTSLSDTDAKPIMVIRPNLAPSGTDSAKSMPEDGVFVLGASHFGFSDSDGDAFAGIRISAAPMGGKLFFDADGAGGAAPVQVTAFPSALFAAADIAAGKLTFVPTANLNGTAWVDFQVHDDGGTSWGGQDADASANRLTLNIAPINDAPSPAFNGVLVAEHSAVGTVVGQASATDIDSDAASLAFSLDDDAGGRFDIDTLTGEVTVLNRGLLDYDDVSSHQIVIRVTDPNGAFTTVAGTITLTDMAEVLTGGAGADWLYVPTSEDWVIQGMGGADKLGGGNGQDRLDGGAGADHMSGFGGDDAYWVDDPADFVLESAGGGNDIVTSSVDYTLRVEVEQLVLIGGAINGVGNAAANRLVGNGAANSLNGGAGADSLEGGAGDDLYFVDLSADRIVELAGQGSDTVRSSASYTLSDHVEQLILTGGGNINAGGNGLANTITGNNGNNRLDGKGGADTMAGGTGHDTYVVDHAGDQAVEAGSSGNDTVESAVGYTLPVHFEKLVLTGGLGIDGRGNAGANTITGNSRGNFLSGGSGNDVIDGGAGNDQLMGGNGADRVKGGAGDDRFYFNVAPGAGNADRILDFSSADDAIHLLRSVFTRAGGNGTLAPSAFHQGSAAADAGDRILYDAATGNIFYDADGTGAAAALLFATVSAGTPISHADFVIYG